MPQRRQDGVGHCVVLLLAVVMVTLLIALGCASTAFIPRLIVVGVSHQDHALDADQHLSMHGAPLDKQCLAWLTLWTLEQHPGLPVNDLMPGSLLLAWLAKAEGRGQYTVTCNDPRNMPVAQQLTEQKERSPGMFLGACTLHGS